jgi:hypothetical protein
MKNQIPYVAEITSAVFGIFLVTIIVALLMVPMALPVSYLPIPWTQHVSMDRSIGFFATGLPPERVNDIACATATFSLARMIAKSSFSV